MDLQSKKIAEFDNNIPLKLETADEKIARLKKEEAEKKKKKARKENTATQNDDYDDTGEIVADLVITIAENMHHVKPAKTLEFGGGSFGGGGAGESYDITPKAAGFAGLSASKTDDVPIILTGLSSHASPDVSSLPDIDHETILSGIGGAAGSFFETAGEVIGNCFSALGDIISEIDLGDLVDHAPNGKHRQAAPYKKPRLG